MNDLARSVEYLFAGDFKDLLGDEGRVRVRHLDDRRFGIGVVTILMPEDGAGIDRIAQDIGDAGIGPLPAGAPVVAVRVEDFGDILETFAVKGHGEDCPCDHGLGFIDLEATFDIGADLHEFKLIAVGWNPAVPETSHGVFFKPAHRVLGEVGGVELINGLNNALKKLAGRAIVKVFIDGEDLNAAFAQERLVDDRILAVAGKPIEFPDDDGFKGRFFLFGNADHALERWPVGRARAFCLVYEFLHDGPATSLGVIPECFKL